MPERTNRGDLSTKELCDLLEKLTRNKTDELSVAAREMAWRVNFTLEQHRCGAPDAAAVLLAFPDEPAN